MSMNLIFLVSLVLGLPAVAFLGSGLFGKIKPIIVARFATSCIGFGVVAAVASLFYMGFSGNSISYLMMRFSPLSLLLSVLILFVSFVVHRFSLRYLDGDRLYSRYFLNLSAITLSAVIMVLADNLFIFWGAWSLSNLFLILLMVHKSEWSAAKNAGWLACKTLLPGCVSLLIAFLLMSFHSHTFSIEALIQDSSSMSTIILWMTMGLVCITALIQSANWPFHRWLLSSLNSPTPVSALMHAGLVNGGGILIVKFAPLFSMHESLLTILFIFGAISALLGTFCKLIQNDIKRMLASSTLAQMGFMMMQCGLGLFAAAIAHLCWHGLFKAYLFLSSGGAVAQNSHQNRNPSYGVLSLVVASAGGALGMLSFAYMTSKPIFSLQATTFLLVFAFVAGTQLMLALIGNPLQIKKIAFGLIFACLGGLMYGGSIHLIELFIPHMTTYYLPSLSLIHGVALVLFLAPWVAFNFGLSKKIAQSKWWSWLYMSVMNLSQPASKTVTTLRTHYHC